MAKQYNVDNVQIVLMAGGIPYILKCRHEDGFEDDPNTESASSTIGSCGQKVVNVSVDNSVNITISFLYGSSEHKTMEMIYQLWQASKGVFPMMITVTDPNTGESYIYNNVSFKKKASLKFGNETGTEARAWEFEAENRVYVALG